MKAKHIKNTVFEIILPLETTCHCISELWGISVEKTSSWIVWFGNYLCKPLESDYFENCLLQSKFNFLLQIFNITLAVEKTKSYQMHIYTVNHNASYEVMIVDPINPILKSYKYVYVRA